MLNREHLDLQIFANLIAPWSHQLVETISVATNKEQNVYPYIVMNGKLAGMTAAQSDKLNGKETTL